MRQNHVQTDQNLGQNPGQELVHKWESKRHIRNQIKSLDQNPDQNSQNPSWGQNQTEARSEPGRIQFRAKVTSYHKIDDNPGLDPSELTKKTPEQALEPTTEWIRA